MPHPNRLFIAHHHIAPDEDVNEFPIGPEAGKIQLQQTLGRLNTYVRQCCWLSLIDPQDRHDRMGISVGFTRSWKRARTWLLGKQ